MKIKISDILVIVFLFIVLGLCNTDVKAAPVKMSDGQLFDAQYYAQDNPDVVAVFGTDQTGFIFTMPFAVKRKADFPMLPVPAPQSRFIRILIPYIMLQDIPMLPRYSV